MKEASASRPEKMSELHKMLLKARENSYERGVLVPYS